MRYSKFFDTTYCAIPHIGNFDTVMPLYIVLFDTIFDTYIHELSIRKLGVGIRLLGPRGGCGLGELAGLQREDLHARQVRKYDTVLYFCPRGEVNVCFVLSRANVSL